MIVSAIFQKHTTCIQNLTGKNLLRKFGNKMLTTKSNSARNWVGETVV